MALDDTSSRTDDYQPDSNEAQNPGDVPDEQFVILKRWFQEARDKSQDWRKEATEDYGFVAGHQWTPEDESALKEQMRPMVVYNLLGIMIDAVGGMEITNRQEVRYLPRQIGDAGVNELLTAAAKWFRDESNSEETESDAFRDTATCGMAWVDTRLDYEDNQNGTAVSERIDPLEMYWDPVAKKRNLKDRRYQVRAKRMPLTEARQMFPDFEDASLDADWAVDMPGQQGTEPHDATEAKFYKNDQAGRDNKGSRKLVTILEFQWWDRESYLRIKDPQTGELKPYDLAKGQKLIKLAKSAGIALQSVKAKRKRYQRAFVGGEVLECGESPYPNGFTCNPITGKRDRNKNSWYGLVRVMKDPQRWTNKYLSTLQHYISTTGRGVLVETGVFENVRKAEEDWSKADSITMVKAGAISGGKIAGKPGGQVPQEVMGLLEFSTQIMPRLTGLNPELLGMAEQEQPGILEYQRKQAGMTILAPIFDALRQFRKVQGDVLLYYIQNYFSDGRLIRIDGEQGKKYIPLLRDQTLGEYDVIVDEATSSPNMKEQTWVALQPLLPIIGKVLPPSVWVEIIPYLPLPESLTAKLKQIIAQQAQNPQQDPEKQAKMLDAQTGMMEAQTNQFQAKLEAQKVQQEGQDGPARLQMEAEKTKAQVENLKANSIAALVKSGVAMSQGQLDTFQQALDGLIGAHGQSLDHAHTLAQNAQLHNQTMQQQSQAHGHAMAQTAQQAEQASTQQTEAHNQTLVQQKQAADLAPKPQGNA